MNRLKSYIRITVLTLCVFVALAVQSLAEPQRFALPATEAFIAKWSQSGGSELGSSQNFLLELCDILEVQRPSSPRADLRDNTYTFEKQVSLNGPGGKNTSGRIDLYKRGAFIWESKQGVRQFKTDKR